jgi:xylulokinase
MRKVDIIGYLIGYDLGSSSVKASLVDSSTGRLVVSASSPSGTEMEILAPKPGWAEQNPSDWWTHAKNATAILADKAGIDLRKVDAIGISYQMHGLVLVDDKGEVLRPSIIWCDSRAVEIGEKARDAIGSERCLNRMLNYPGNFTASKLAWVKENEPSVYRKIHRFMLPGDYLAMMLTGVIATTVSGLSEGILWDLQNERIAEDVLSGLDIDPGLIADIVPTFGIQGEVNHIAADELGLREGTPVSYRAGDQPNNALSLNVLNPAEIAATAGTSGVVYGVSGKPVSDPASRINTFVHVNHSPSSPRYGVLLCVNGTGILNSWLRNKIVSDGNARVSYDEMNRMASEIAPGSDGLVFIPYGNGAERTLKNRDIGASFHGLNFNLHDRRHVFRSAQEGIVFALNYGVEIMREMGLAIGSVRAGYANMFLSPVFQQAFANTVGATLQLYDTDGCQGAARGAGIGAGIFKDEKDAFKGLELINTIELEENLASQYQAAWKKWLDTLNSHPIMASKGEPR